MQNDLLKLERLNLQKPMNRTIAYIESVTKPCLYTAVQSVTLGGAGSCKLEFKTEADIKVTAPKIVLKPGVKALKDAKFLAKAGTVVNGQTKSTVVISKPKVTYLTPSEFRNLIYDYSTGNTKISAISENTIPNTIITLYPNPVGNFLMLKTSKPIKGQLEISNIYGQVLLRHIITNTGFAKIDVSALKSDMYIVKITGDNNYTTKIIKN